MVLVSMHDEPRFHQDNRKTGHLGSSVQSLQPEYLAEDTSLEKAANRMLNERLPYLLVVNAQGGVIGELSRDDLLRYLLVSLRKNPDAYTDSLKKVLMVCAPPTLSTTLNQ